MLAAMVADERSIPVGDGMLDAVWIRTLGMMRRLA